MHNSRELPRAKAVTTADQSDAILVSFDAQWYDHLLARDFRAVIRKRVPKAKSFDWLYFHINSPVGAICGRAKIIDMFFVTLDEAVGLSGELNLTITAIKKYMSEVSKVGCYRLDRFELAERQARTADLAQRMIYYPPQSFLILSKRGKAIIDDMIGLDAAEDLELRRARRA